VAASQIPATALVSCASVLFCAVKAGDSASAENANPMNNAKIGSSRANRDNEGIYSSSRNAN